MGSITLGDVSIAYDDVGDGDVVAFVHGHPFDRTMWSPQIARLSAAGWRCVAADLRGYGESAVVPGVTTLDVFARDLVGLLDALGAREAVVVGLSMGGQIAMEVTRLFPERVRALVLADTSPLAETPEGKRSRAEIADRLEREGMATYADELLPMMLAPSTIREQPDVAAHVRRMMTRTPAAGAAAALRGRALRPDYRGTLSNTRVPALVVVGTDDAYTSVDDARATAELMPDARLGVIDRAGHMPNLERTEEFDALLLDLLARTRRTSDPARS